MAVHKAELEVVYDYLMIQKDRKEAIGKLLKSENTFVMEGWLPYDEADKLKDKILSKWDAVVEISQAEEGEDFPILLRNHSMVKPFEIVTELYSLPKPGGVDPTAVMSIFFIIFFGLMVSDAGYGLLMAIVAGIMIKKYKLEGIAEKLIKLIFFGGISTFIWGAIFGGWFGDIIQLVTGNPNAVKPLVFNPLDDVMRLLIWSFVLGGIHLYAGMGIQAYVLIREGRY